MIAPFGLDVAREQAPLASRPYHHWTLPDGRSWTELYRCADGFVLRFPGLADFRVTANGRQARCTPVPGTPEETCQHLYLNQVLPLMLSRQGKLVFHASAVALGSDAVAFLAASGHGKSTLAAAFARAGTPFLTDDGLALDAAADGYRALPSHPSLRLWRDARQALMGADSDGVNGAKTRMPAQALLPYCDRSRPLRAAYVLGPGEAPAAAFQRLHGAEALEAWLRHAFLLDVEDRAGLAAHFADVSRLCGAVPCYRLDYPRRFAELARVRQAIAEHAAALGPRP